MTQEQVKELLEAGVEFTLFGKKNEDSLDISLAFCARGAISKFNEMISKYPSILNDATIIPESRLLIGDKLNIETMYKMSSSVLVKPLRQIQSINHFNLVFIKLINGVPFMLSSEDKGAGKLYITCWGLDLKITAPGHLSNQIYVISGYPPVSALRLWEKNYLANQALKRIVSSTGTSITNTKTDDWAEVL